MKFAVVVGNPPYQKNNDLRNRDDAIYHHLMELGFKIAERCVFITPARFLFGVGSTPSAWNQKLLNDRHFQVERYYPDASEVFAHADIKGGLAVTSYHTNRVGTPVEFFIPDATLRAIYLKVKEASEDFAHNMSQIMQVQNKFNLQAVFADYPHYQPLMKTEKRITSAAFAQYPELFHGEVGAGEVQIYGRLNNERCYLAIDPRHLELSPNLDYYKVLVTSANGTGELGETLSTPIIAPPGVGYTQTFIGLGRFTTEFEAQALLKYLKTRFARLLLGLKKTTQNNKTPETWSKIPLQDFTPQADLDWSVSVAELDHQLFTKYGLSVAEQEYILTKVKEMV